MVDQVLIKDIDDCNVPDANLLITEDDTPADNLASTKQQRLLVAQQAEQRAQLLAERLKALGVDPDSI